MDGIIIIILIAVACFYFRRFDKGVYAVGIVDIFLRIFNFLIHNIRIENVSDHLIKYLPESIPVLIDKYTSGLFATILLWVYVIVMGAFLFYTIRAFIRKK